MFNGLKCAVLGSGVVGLTTAIRLAEVGASVRIYAKKFPPETTSNAACALFLPLWIDPAGSENVELSGKALEWSAFSWAKFKNLVETPSSGIRLMKNYEYCSDENERQGIISFFKDHSRVYEEEATRACFNNRHLAIFDTYVIETPLYLKLLKSACDNSNIEFVCDTFSEIDDLQRLPESVVFNCLGLGAGQVFCDPSLFPVKGQLSLYKWNASSNIDFAIGNNDLCLIPRSDHLILGSLYQKEFDHEGEDQSAHEFLLHELFNRCIVPVSMKHLLIYLKESKPIRLLAGLRPARNGGVRIAAEYVKNKMVIHNYGHGGSGITVSWGTVEDSLQLLKTQLLTTNNP